MDNYESAITALKIPFIPLGLRFPVRDVLKAVVINWMVRFNALRSNSHSQPLSSVSVSLLSLFTNDQ